MIRAAVLAVAMLVATGVATAESMQDGKRIVGILDIKGPSPEIERSFENGLEAQLDTKHYWLVSRATLRERLKTSTKWTEGCVVGVCLNEVRVQTQVEIVIQAALTGAGTSFGYVVTLLRTDTGKVVSQEHDRCDVCTLNEAMATATLATVKLVNAIPERLPDEADEQGAAVEVAANAVRTQLVGERRGFRRRGIVLAIVGLAVSAAGAAVYLLADDRPAYGLAVATAGGGLALGGVVALTF